MPCYLTPVKRLIASTTLSIKLFRILIEKGLCPLVVKVLISLHYDQLVRIRWGAKYTDKFSVCNGVKQGGNISPILFTIYSDQILMKLKSNGSGCHIGSSFCGAVAYADDIVLLAPSKIALQDTLTVAASSGECLNLIFNPSKCQLLTFDPHVDRKVVKSCVNFCNQRVEEVDGDVHLGHYVGRDCINEVVNRAVNDLYRRTNVLLSKFGHCDSTTIYRLFKSFCMSVYGSSLWHFDHSSVDRFFCAWRKCVRRIFRVPPLTHCHLLPGICNDVPIEKQLHSRFINFFSSCINSDNSLVRLLSRLVINGSKSAVSESVSLVCH